jgi:hypothetical protein
MKRRNSGSLKAAYSKQCPGCKHRLPANVHKCGFCGAAPWYWQDDRIIWVSAMVIIGISVVIYSIFFR